MRRILRFFLWVLVVVVVLVGVVVYFVYSRAPEVPRLSGKLAKASIQVGGRERTYLTYVPRELAKGAPLVVVMHGSGQNGARMRAATGFGFERLAGEHGFAVVYPDAYEGYWNACNIVGDYGANKLNIDDVKFLTGIADKLVGEIGVDPARVFAIGMSRGGHMAFRLALESTLPLSRGRRGIRKRPDAGELQMQALAARHFLRDDHERYERSHQPVRWW